MSCVEALLRFLNLEKTLKNKERNKNNRGIDEKRCLIFETS